MKKFLFAATLVLGTAVAASAQTTPANTTSGNMIPPAGNESMPKPDATIVNQANVGGANQTGPGERKTMRNDRMMKRKNGKMKTKMQSPSTM